MQEIDLKMERGSVGSLEGRAMIYSTFRQHGKDDLYIGYYITTDVEDFVKHTNISYNEANARRQVDMMEKDERTHYAAITVPRSRRRVFDGDHDVVNAGTYEDLGECIMSITEKTKEYNSAHHMQDREKEKRVLVTPNQKQPVSHDKPSIPYKNYNTFEGDNLKGYLLTTFVNPLFDVTNVTLRADLESYLRLFGSSYQSPTDFSQLIDAIKERDVELVDACLRKIAAVHEEDFSEAEKMKNAISLLSK